MMNFFASCPTIAMIKKINESATVVADVCGRDMYLSKDFTAEWLIRICSKADVDAAPILFFAKEKGPGNIYRFISLANKSANKVETTTWNEDFATMATNNASNWYTMLRDELKGRGIEL